MDRKDRETRDGSAWGREEGGDSETYSKNIRLGCLRFFSKMWNRKPPLSTLKKALVTSRLLQKELLPPRLEVLSPPVHSCPPVLSIMHQLPSLIYLPKKDLHRVAIKRDRM